MNAAYQAEAAWVSQNAREAELIAQRRAGYSDEIRDQFIARKRQYHMFPVTDAEFVAALQKAADWLTTRKVLPETSLSPIISRSSEVHYERPGQISDRL